MSGGMATYKESYVCFIVAAACVDMLGGSFHLCFCFSNAQLLSLISRFMLIRSILHLTTCNDFK